MLCPRAEQVYAEFVRRHCRHRQATHRYGDHPRSTSRTAGSYQRDRDRLKSPATQYRHAMSGFATASTLATVVEQLMCPMTGSARKKLREKGKARYAARPTRTRADRRWLRAERAAASDAAASRNATVTSWNRVRKACLPTARSPEVVSLIIWCDTDTNVSPRRRKKSQRTLRATRRSAMFVVMARLAKPTLPAVGPSASGPHGNMNGCNSPPRPHRPEA